MNRLRREGLLEIARAEVTRAAQATLARVHGDKSAPLIDFYSSLELAAEEWLARRDAAAAQAAKSAVFAPGKLPDV